MSDRGIFSEDLGNSPITTADKISKAHIGVMRVVWQKDRDDLNKKRQECQSLTNEIANLNAELDFQNVTNQLHMLHGSESKHPSSFVDFMRSLLSTEFRDMISLQCCVRSGNLWIVVDATHATNSSSSSMTKIRDESFDNVLRSLDVGNIYHMQQLVPSEIMSTTSAKSGSFYVVPVFPSLCVWLVGRNSPPAVAAMDDDDDTLPYAAATALKDQYFPMLEPVSQYCIATVVQELEERRAAAALLVQVKLIDWLTLHRDRDIDGPTLFS